MKRRDFEMYYVASPIGTQTDPSPRSYKGAAVFASNQLLG